MRIGSFYLDVERKILCDAQHNEVNLEARTLQVLLYLIEHHDRYVSLSELHENIWSGRIVSDSAVRQTISKLRKLLDDKYDEPKIIRSVVKKGYRFIFPIMIPPKNDIAVKRDNEASLSDERQWFKLSKLKQSWKRYLLLLTTTLAIGVLWLLSGVSVTESQGLNPGQNTGFAINPATNIAYYVNKDQLTGTYKLLKKEKQHSIILAETQHALIYPVFSQSQQLWVGWQGAEGCGIYRVDLSTEKSSLLQPVLFPCSVISHISVSGNHLLISAQLNIGETFQLVDIDTSNLTINYIKPRVVSQAPIITAMSAQKKWIAIVTHSTDGQQLAVYEADSHKMIDKWYFDKRVVQLRWHEQYLYLATVNGIYRFDAKNWNKQSLLKSDTIGQFNLIYDFWSNNESLFILQERQSIETQLHIEQYQLSHEQRLSFRQSFYLNTDALNITGDSPSTLFYSRRDNEQYQIVNLISDQVVYQSQYLPSLLYFDAKQQCLLFVENKKIILFSLTNKKILSSVKLNGAVNGAFHLAKQQSVWLLTKSPLGWQTLQWDYLKNSLTQIAVNELARFVINGKTYWIDSRDSKIKTLKENAVIDVSQTLPFYSTSQWGVVGNALWFTRSIAAGATLYKISAQDDWRVIKMLHRDEIIDLTVGKENLMLQTLNRKSSDLYSVAIWGEL
ncbi:MAG: winged helix-turn-helix domain-containing protein [Psychrobium sp.]|nr:winged helix-turn-helix domain-containing protein [Psychrobium sp.]